MQLLEVEKGAVELKKGTSDSDIKKYTDKGIDVQLVDPATEKLEEEAGRKYTTEESAAVGKTVAKSLLKVLRGQGDEVVDLRLTGVGVNKFNVHVKYGQEKGQDTFRFTLNPDTEDITLDLGKGDHQQLVDFVITQGNTVSLPTPELEDKLTDAMKKYTSEPSDDQYNQMAAMEPETDPSQIGKYIPEGDMNDPVAVKLRASKMQAPTTKQTPNNSAKLSALQAERTKILRDMEQEAEPEGGPIANDYAERLTRVDNAIAKLGGSPMEEANPSQIDQNIAEDTTQTFKVGDKVKYLGHPAEITFVGKDNYTGETYYSVNYNKGTGSTKASNIYAKSGSIRLDEKHLTKPELKKREEIVKAMKAKGAPKSPKTYAIATAQAEKLAEDLDIGHQDDEPGMLLGDLYGIMQSAKSLYELVSQFQGQQEVDFPHWWQAKIVNAKANLSAARQYLDYEVNKPQQVNIAAVTLQEGKKK